MSLERIACFARRAQPRGVRRFAQPVGWVAKPIACRNRHDGYRYNQPILKALKLVGWVEPLRNPSHIAIGTMGFASALGRRTSACAIAQPILRTSLQASRCMRSFMQATALTTPFSSTAVDRLSLR